MTAPLIIGTRGSRLALAQAEAVAHALRVAHPHIDVQLQVISTEGDRVTSGTLPSWGQGVFVRDIERALLDGRIDLAVHSLKDIPPQTPQGLAIVAVPRRADPGDVLVTRDGRGLDDLPSGARVGTSSLRRAAFLRAYRPDLEYAPVRGNVDTRWRKLLDPAQGYDALVLAAAGLARLGLDEVPRSPISTDVLLPAPGQGALALESRAEDSRVRDLARAVHDAPSAAAVAAERRALRDLEGGCRLPVAALATTRNQVQSAKCKVQSEGACDSHLGSGIGAKWLRLEAAVAAPDGSRVLRHGAEGPLGEAEALGEAVAQVLLAQGAAGLLAAATEPAA